MTCPRRPAERPSTDRMATCYISLDAIARLLHLPDGVKVAGVFEAIQGNYRRHGECVLHLEGEGLPESCRVDTGDPIRCVGLVLTHNSDGVLEFDRWKE